MLKIAADTLVIFASRGDAANAGIEFIELKHDEDQIAEELVVPVLRMAVHAVKPAGDGSVGVPSEADHNGHFYGLRGECQGIACTALKVECDYL